MQRDAAGEAGGLDGGARSLDVDLDRLDADAGDVVELDEPNEVLRVATSRVEDDRARSEVLLRQLVEPVGPDVGRGSRRDADRRPEVAGP